MNLIVLGPPASGKGTQAELLAEKFGLYHLQTGEVARHLAEHDARIKEMVDSGKLIPEEEMTMYVMDFLHTIKPDLKNILFEGYPRFISQYDALEKFLKSKNEEIDAVIFLDISQEETIKRMSSRRICDACGKSYSLITNPPKTDGVCDDCGGKLIHRPDDVPDAIKVRFQYYQDNTKKLIDYLNGKDKLIKIDGTRPIDAIFSDILKKLEAK